VSISTSDGTYTLDATYLVGADGGRSTVRKMPVIEFLGHGPRSSATTSVRRNNVPVRKSG
jgi:2-polyprenyl-6-methoxyphenol hydroxylase-like FAD-dependent oxidoreductase